MLHVIYLHEPLYLKSRNEHVKKSNSTFIFDTFGQWNNDYDKSQVGKF